MSSVAVIGVPSQSGGRPIGVARGVGALRAAGLVTALGAGSIEVIDRGDVALPRPDAARDPNSGVVNPAGLSALVRTVSAEVGAARWDGAFPLVVGGDCPMLLGGLSAVRNAGLLHVDGHEDAYPPMRSPTGDSADSEIAFATGVATFSWDEELAASQPLVSLERLAMLGQRDGPDLARRGVASLGDRCLLLDEDAVHADPQATVDKALAQVREAPGGFWFHLDWDVLSNDEIGSVIFPRDGGLTWDELGVLARAALADPACRGWSAGTYNPDLDPEGSDAVRIVGFLADAITAMDHREERAR
jgi:arginase